MKLKDENNPRLPTLSCFCYEFLFLEYSFDFFSPIRGTRWKCAFVHAHLPKTVFFLETMILLPFYFFFSRKNPKNLKIKNMMQIESKYFSVEYLFKFLEKFKHCASTHARMRTFCIPKIMFYVKRSRKFVLIVRFIRCKNTERF